MRITGLRVWVLALALMVLSSLAGAAPSVTPITYGFESNIFYRTDSTETLNDYMKERCFLDVYYPEGIRNFPTIIWFHAGGIVSGSKFIPEQLKNKKMAVVGVNYRLSPKAKCPEYNEDAAAAIAWVFKNIETYGGSTRQIYVSGHSAGGYLTLMAGLDKKLLAKYGVDANQIAGLIPFSGQAITHFTVRKEKGIPSTQPTIDEYAPLYYVRPDAPPLVLITGDRELEMLGRYEENAYLMRMMKVAGHKKTTLYELQGFTHGSMAIPSFTILLEQVTKLSEEINKGEKAGK